LIILIEANCLVSIFEKIETSYFFFQEIRKNKERNKKQLAVNFFKYSTFFYHKNKWGSTKNFGFCFHFIQ